MENYISELAKIISDAETAIIYCGKFHLDDAAAVAFLNICREKVGKEPLKILRVSEVIEEIKNNPRYIILGIGGGEFDDHGIDGKKREDGTPHWVLGLIARKFYPLISDDPVEYEKFDKLIEHDYSLGKPVSLLTTDTFWNPLSWDLEDPSKANAEFNKAVKLMSTEIDMWIYESKMSVSLEKSRLEIEQI